ncbi:hypothetical protein [Novosphingobium sp.]|uniref:hypothetical protein n=1 Tax=Novosphingobium sp. TaxID=1874826 RepID=UPI00286B9DCB|nr:hypothetical protein [Novosphingobium sp.]
MTQANSDELSTFITSTLSAIAEGIRNAQGSQIESAHGTGVSGFTAPKEVEFDVAVSAKKTDAVGGGLKVAVFGIGANTKADLGSENATISRIRFSVPTNFKSTVEMPSLEKLGRGLV